MPDQLDQPISPARARALGAREVADCALDFALSYEARWMLIELAAAVAGHDGVAQIARTWRSADDGSRRLRLQALGPDRSEVDDDHRPGLCKALDRIADTFSVDVAARAIRGPRDGAVVTRMALLSSTGTVGKLQP